MPHSGIAFEDLDALLDELRSLPPVATSFTVSTGIEAVLRRELLCYSRARQMDCRGPKLSHYLGVPLLTNPHLADDKCIATMSDGTVRVLDLKPEDPDAICPE